MSNSLPSSSYLPKYFYCGPHTAFAYHHTYQHSSAQLESHFFLKIITTLKGLGVRKGWSGEMAASLSSPGLPFSAILFKELQEAHSVVSMTSSDIPHVLFVVGKAPPSIWTSPLCLVQSSEGERAVSRTDTALIWTLLSVPSATPGPGQGSWGGLGLKCCSPLSHRTPCPWWVLLQGIKLCGLEIFLPFPSLQASSFT